MNKKLTPPPQHKIGQIGEKQAANFLKQQNYQILKLNYRYKHWEIDLIALDQQTSELVFVEVKTRSTDTFGRPEQAVTQRKLYNLQRAAQIYIEKHNLDNNFRFDIISILPDETKHFKNITVNF